jgi:hypothetical protein
VNAVKAIVTGECECGCDWDIGKAEMSIAAGGIRQVFISCSVIDEGVLIESDMFLNLLLSPSEFQIIEAIRFLRPLACGGWIRDIVRHIVSRNRK